MSTQSVRVLVQFFDGETAHGDYVLPKDIASNEALREILSSLSGDQLAHVRRVEIVGPLEFLSPKTSGVYYMNEKLWLTWKKGEEKKRKEAAEHERRMRKELNKQLEADGIGRTGNHLDTGVSHTGRVFPKGNTLFQTQPTKKEYSPPFQERHCWSSLDGYIPGDPQHTETWEEGTDAPRYEIVHGAVEKGFGSGKWDFDLEKE